jgi:hypothetical protein
MSDLSQAITSAIDVMFKMRVVIKEQRDLIETQAARIAELEKALDFYAHRDHYTTPYYNTRWGLVAEDCGKRARAALGGKGNE